MPELKIEDAVLLIDASRSMLRKDFKPSRLIVGLLAAKNFIQSKLSIDFNEKGFSGISNFFLTQSHEERDHMTKLISYVMEKDSSPSLPKYNFMEDTEETFNVLSHFENSLHNEREVTNAINKIVSKIYSVKKDQIAESRITLKED